MKQLFDDVLMTHDDVITIIVGWTGDELKGFISLASKAFESYLKNYFSENSEV